MQMYKRCTVGISYKVFKIKLLMISQQIIAYVLVLNQWYCPKEVQIPVILTVCFGRPGPRSRLSVLLMFALLAWRASFFFCSAIFWIARNLFFRIWILLAMYPTLAYSGKESVRFASCVLRMRCRLIFYCALWLWSIKHGTLDSYTSRFN